MILLMIISIGGFSQTTVTLPAVKDNTIYQDFPGNSNGMGENIFLGANSALSPRRALIKFDIAGSIPAGATITSVTLTLTLNKTNSVSNNVRLFKLLSDWGEGTSNAGTGNPGDGQGVVAAVNDATWVCRNSDGAGGCSLSWTVPGGNFSSTVSAVTPVGSFLTNYTWSSVQMVADVQSWINVPAGNFGWLIMGDESGSTTAKRFGSREHSEPVGTQSRPRLSVTYNNPVPVTLVSFSALEAKTGISLRWQTSAEYNNAFFNIEHSLDGTSFTSIGRINGAGSSAIIHSYQYLDKGVDVGKHYYRLAQTDINGTIHYSNIISITSKTEHLQLVISPNPVNNWLNISSLRSSGGLSYTIINSTGRLLRQGMFYSNQILVSDIPPGFYMLQIIDANGRIRSGLFIKQ